MHTSTLPLSCFGFLLALSALGACQGDDKSVGGLPPETSSESGGSGGEPGGGAGSGGTTGSGGGGQGPVPTSQCQPLPPGDPEKMFCVGGGPPCPGGLECWYLFDCLVEEGCPGVCLTSDAPRPPVGCGPSASGSCCLGDAVCIDIPDDDCDHGRGDPDCPAICLLP